MDGWEYYAVQATKQQHLQLDKNKILLEPYILLFLPHFSLHSGRHNGLMVSAPDSGLRGLGSNPCWVIVLCSLARH